jgi:hypothetical protein
MKKLLFLLCFLSLFSCKKDEIVPEENMNTLNCETLAYIKKLVFLKYQKNITDDKIEPFKFSTSVSNTSTTFTDSDYAYFGDADVLVKTYLDGGTFQTVEFYTEGVSSEIVAECFKVFATGTVDYPLYENQLKKDLLFQTIRIVTNTNPVNSNIYFTGYRIRIN